MFSHDPTPFNVGNGEEKSILEVAQTIVKLQNSSSPISFRPLPTDDPLRRRPDLSKLQSISNYAPRVDFATGILKTLVYFQELLTRDRTL